MKRTFLILAALLVGLTVRFAVPSLWAADPTLRDFPNKYESKFLDAQTGHGGRNSEFYGKMFRAVYDEVQDAHRRIACGGGVVKATRAAMVAILKADLTTALADTDCDFLVVTALDDDGAGTPRQYRWLAGSAAATTADILATGEGGTGRWIAVQADVDSTAGAAAAAMLRKADATAPAALFLAEDTDGGVHKVTMSLAALLGADRTISWPDQDVTMSTVISNASDGASAKSSVDAAVSVTAGAGDAGKLVELDGAGLLGPTMVPLATELAVGGRELATQAESNAGTDDATILTPLKHAAFVGTLTGIRTTKTHALFAGSGQATETAGLQTTDATPTVLWTKALSDDTAYWIEADIISRSVTGTTAENSYKLRVLVHRRAAGAATLGGAGSINLFTDEEDLDWAATFDVNANDVRLVVTGDAGATSLAWVGTIRWQAVSDVL